MKDFELEDFKVLEVVENIDCIDYGIKLLGADCYWSKTRGENIGVAVLDTGIDINHPDLAPNIKMALDFSFSGNPIDVTGHGTHCAGIIAGIDNGVGVIGVAPKSNIYSLKVIADDDGGSFYSIAKALEWVLQNHKEHGIRIVSMSFGADEYYPDIEELFRKFKDLGIITVCAAGNDGNVSKGQSDVSFPARLAAKGLCISVGAIDKNMRLASFSSTGLNGEITLVSPGVEIYSTYLNGRYAKLSGTSMATPAIAGLIALLISYHDHLTNLDLVIDHLRKLSVPLGEGWQFGFGMPRLTNDE